MAIFRRSCGPPKMGMFRRCIFAHWSSRQNSCPYNVETGLQNDRAVCEKLYESSYVRSVLTTVSWLVSLLVPELVLLSCSSVSARVPYLRRSVGMWLVGSFIHIALRSNAWGERAQGVRVFTPSVRRE